jgi:hypothetical protein
MIHSHDESWCLPPGELLRTHQVLEANPGAFGAGATIFNYGIAAQRRPPLPPLRLLRPIPAHPSGGPLRSVTPELQSFAVAHWLLCVASQLGFVCRSHSTPPINFSPRTPNRVRARGKKLVLTTDTRAAGKDGTEVLYLSQPRPSLRQAGAEGVGDAKGQKSSASISLLSSCARPACAACPRPMWARPSISPEMVRSLANARDFARAVP